MAHISVPVTFIGGTEGAWQVQRMQTVIGPSLPNVPSVAVVDGRHIVRSTHGVWVLRGVSSYERYVTRAERAALVAQQPRLGRREAIRAALIPVRKSAAWWELTADVRREILEDDSHHIAIGLKYLPAIARRLYHCRELGEPFDFLTWFEYSPSDADAFEELVDALRATAEWAYVDREIDLRLARIEI